MIIDLAQFAQNAARLRGDPEVELRFFTEAVAQIERSAVSVERYPSGSPTVKGIYEIAVRLAEEAVRQQKK